MKVILDKIELIHDWDKTERFTEQGKLLGMRAYFNSVESVFIYNFEGILEVIFQVEKKGIRDKALGYYNQDGKKVMSEISDKLCKKQEVNLKKFPPHTQLALKGIDRIIRKIRQPLSVTFIQDLAADRSTKYPTA